jgi:hypothetical protein
MKNQEIFKHMFIMKLSEKQRKIKEFKTCRITSSNKQEIQKEIATLSAEVVFDFFLDSLPPLEDLTKEVYTKTSAKMILAKKVLYPLSAVKYKIIFTCGVYSSYDGSFILDCHDLSSHYVEDAVLL